MRQPYLEKHPSLPHRFLLKSWTLLVSEVCPSDSLLWPVGMLKAKGTVQLVTRKVALNGKLTSDATE